MLSGRASEGENRQPVPPFFIHVTRPSAAPECDEHAFCFLPEFWVQVASRNPGNLLARYFEPDDDGAGGSFQMSIVQRHWPSGSRRQIVIPRPGTVNGVPLGPGTVMELLLRM